jgi:hypothetical protein
MVVVMIIFLSADLVSAVAVAERVWSLELNGFVIAKDFRLLHVWILGWDCLLDHPRLFKTDYVPRSSRLDTVAKPLVVIGLSLRDLRPTSSR